MYQFKANEVMSSALITHRVFFDLQVFLVQIWPQMKCKTNGFVQDFLFQEHV